MGLHLPAVNAALNGTAALFLLLGLAAIRSGRRELHGRLMLSAFLVSSAFLACYLYYHAVVVRGEPTRYHGTGSARAAYMVLLVSHTILATATVPLVLRTLWLARRERWVAHRRLARWTYPIWMYVSVTGVAVYAVLYHFNPAPVLP